MSIGFRSGEDWSVSDGAPVGVGFDVKVPSADGRRTYRIARQEHHPPALSGYIVHTPACPAWRSGHHMCAHVLRALELTEDPLRRFVLDVIESWPFVCLDETAIRGFAGAMAQSAQQALDAAQALDAYDDQQSEPKAASAQAIAEFDRGPIGASR